MDYIPGESLDRHIAQKNLPAREIVRLVAKICDAVKIAHLRGIIHRDLKPSNIRVDLNGEPHVLDFGLALTAGGGNPMRVGEFMGTIAYASPEQTEGEPSRIDLRTDIYSLGVILYQLLTGRFPYNTDMQTNLLKMFEAIRREEPRPLGKTCPNLKDLDRIVLHCLAKDREQRYQSVGELARDLRRCLNGEPIEERRELFFKRHPSLRNWDSILDPVTTRVSLALAFLGGSSFIFWFLWNQLALSLPWALVGLGVFALVFMGSIYAMRWLWRMLRLPRQK